MAADSTVYLRTTKAAVLDAIRSLPAACSGHVSETTNAAQALLTRIGLTALGHIREAFVAKARGGTDDCGLAWPKLAKSTVAYGRRHPGVLWPGSKRAPFAPSWMLTTRQRERWWDLYRGFAGTASAGSAYHARGVARGYAAARAWMALKAEGAKTLMGQYGDTQVEILRNTGLLLNSLSPGVDVDAAGGTSPQIPNQVFRVGAGWVIVGTTRKFAAVHHHGVPGKIPQRRLWAPPSQWPRAWWDDMLEQLRDGLIDITIFMIQRRAA